MKEFDLVIVGAGAAGMRAAIGAVRHDLRVAVISKVHPLRSSSSMGDEGLNAVPGGERGGKSRPDTFSASMKVQYRDSWECGYRFADTDALQVMIQRAPAVVRELERWGCPLSLNRENTYSLRKTAAMRMPLNLHAADKTGHAVLSTLYEQCLRLRKNKPENLRFFDEWFVLKLLVSNNTAAGVIAMQIESGKLEVFRAKSLIWASGGSGRIYGGSSNALISSGWGLAMPALAGVTLKDMEFMQFNPAQLHGSHIQITEAVRGQGALMLNRKGERFLASYNDSAKHMELSRQDVISRNILREILAGRGVEASGVHLDMRTLGRRRLKGEYSRTRDLCRRHAESDPVSQLIPIRPGQSFSIGGIHTAANAASDLHGLFAAGECANPGVHGANLCEGDQLTAALVFAGIAADSAAEYIARRYNARKINESLFANALEEEESRLRALLSSGGGVRPGVLRDKMQEIMDRQAGVFRDGMGLVEAAKGVKELKKVLRRDLKIDGNKRAANFGFLEAIELRGSLEIADIVLQAALKRNESVGVHFRNDFPAFKGKPRHSLTVLKKNKIRIRYTAVKSKHPILDETGD
jgi:succinate dehydrogenase / fumarate reductase flavoprotein subunit